MIRYITELPSSEWENSFPRPVVLLGSTGSIGVNTLRIIEKHPDLFQVVALAGGRNVERLIEQALRWRPPYLGIQTEEGRKALLAALPSGYEPEILVGPQGYAELASLPEASTILSAQMGAAGLRATMAAAEAGKVICLANKESLVLAGGMLRETCARTGAVILPVDSEHNAVFQGLRGRNPETVRRIILTASGGPFRGKKRDFLATVTPAQGAQAPQLEHGRENHHRLGVDDEQRAGDHRSPSPLRPAAGTHRRTGPSAVAGALAGGVRRRLPHGAGGNPGHAYAHRLLPRMAALFLDAGVPPLDLCPFRRLDLRGAGLLHSFPCLELACRTIGKGSALPVALNAANQVAVEAFLSGRIGFAGHSRHHRPGAGRVFGPRFRLRSKPSKPLTTKPGSASACG